MNKPTTMSDSLVRLIVIGGSFLTVWIGLITALGAWSNGIILFWSAIAFGFAGVVLLFDWLIGSSV